MRTSTILTPALLVLLGVFPLGCGDDDAGADAAADALPDDAGIVDDGAPASADAAAVTEDATTTTEDAAAACTANFAPAKLASVTLTITETGGPTNTWVFPAGNGTTGNATLSGSGTFPFTYSRSDGCASVLTFEVDGTDRYDMTWTSTTTGTFVESFDGTPGTTGAFVLVE